MDVIQAAKLWDNTSLDSLNLSVRQASQTSDRWAIVPREDAERVANQVAALQSAIRSLQNETVRLAEERDKMRDTAKVNYEVMEHLRRDNERLKDSLVASADAIEIVYPAIASRVIGLREMGEARAFEAWSNVAKTLYGAAKSARGVLEAPGESPGGLGQT